MALKLFQFRKFASLLKTLVKVLLCFSAAVQAELYLHEGPNGERMISDRPVAGYVLLTKRDTLTNAGTASQIDRLTAVAQRNSKRISATPAESTW